MPISIIVYLLLPRLLVLQYFLVHLLHAHQQFMSLLQHTLVSLASVTVHPFDKHRTLQVRVTFTVHSSRRFTNDRLTVYAVLHRLVVDVVFFAFDRIPAVAVNICCRFKATVLSALNACFFKVRLWP